jgi:hypothetical protein
MGIYNESGILKLQCDVCKARLSSAQAGAVAGVHGQELVLVHAHCKPSYDYFFRVTADRELTIAQYVAEVAAL